ncbi:MAG: c-type cytochrome [Bdellovibrionota bacterium]
MANNTPEEQDDRFYRPSLLWKAFGIGSVIMLVVTIWMVLDDFGREWKAYQTEFFNLKEKKYNEWAKEAVGELDEDELNSLKEQLTAATKEVLGHEKQREKMEGELVDLQTKMKNTLNDFQVAKGEWDVAKYRYEAHYGHEFAASTEVELNAEAGKALAQLNKELANVQRLKDIANQAQVNYESKKAAIAELETARTEAEKALKKYRANIDRLEVNRDDSRFTLTKAARSAPLVDFANPVLRINQIVLNNITDDLNFAQVKKVDRCTTCHLAIDLKGFENEKQPFRTHPRLDVMLGSTSPHPINQIGCTSCHDGRGQSVDFVRAAHTPRNEEQKKEWEKKYHWHEMHHVEEKMLPLQFTEGKCITCHKQTEYVPRAAKVNKSIQTFRYAGCYGCHRVEGWDHLRKPAPSLEKIKGKVTRDWFVKWVRDPKAFNEHTRMPQFFHLSNMQTEKFSAYQEAEIFAITDYIYANSEDYSPNVWLPLGNSERGKELFGQLGCLGCHQIDDYAIEGRSRFGAAPDLSTVGSKVSQKWLQSWLKNPRHYWSETTMPSLRLSDREISDISAYLLSKKNDEFEGLETGKAVAEVQRDVLREYLLRDPKLAPVTDTKVEDELSKLSSHQLSIELGKRAIGRVGCYGCHTIKGFENVAPIGTELSEAGSKLVKKLDFGLIHIEHTRYDWYDKKLEEPRIFDRGIAKEYLDTLRMPWFRFNETERQDLVRFLMGQTSEKRGPGAAKILDAHEAKAEDGMKLIHKYNCQGCHIVQDLYVATPEDAPDYDEDVENLKKYTLEGRILAHYEDPTLGPPSLWGEGKKVITKWVYEFLDKPYPLRGALKVRMPTFQFNNEELNTIVVGWANAGGVEFPFVDQPRPKLTAYELQEAAKLFGRLNCTLCHYAGPQPTTFSDDGGSKGLAPNLWETHKRLHRGWVKDWLHDPQKLMPGTRMPGFWPDGSSPAPDILGGDSDKQIRALTEYLYYIGENKVVRK